MPLNITYNNDIIYNSIKVENTDTGSYYKYVTSQSLHFNAGVEYEITYRIYTEATSSYPFDLYITSSGTDGFLKTNQYGYLVDVVNTDLNTFTEKHHLVTALYNTTASICLLFKYGTYYISEFKVKPYQTNNFSLGEMDLVIPSPASKRTEPISIYPVYIGRNEKSVGYIDVTLVDAGQSFDFSRYTIITGSNLVISHDDNLIEGSLFVGKNLRTGVEISGFDNAMIRSVGYAGYNNATQYNWPGFMLYSGSVLPGSGDNYRGVGLELHGGGNSGSLRYRVDDSGSFLEITGSIYATSGYFAGIISASIGGYIANWQITENDLRSISTTVPFGGGIKLKSSPNPAVQFYTQSAGNEQIWVSLEADTVLVETYAGVSESLASANFNVGNQDLADTQGASMIFNFGWGTASAENGDFVILDARNIILNASSGSQMNCPVLNTMPIIITGEKEKGYTGRIANSWKASDVPYTASFPYFFTTNFSSTITRDKIPYGSTYYGDTWDSGTHSNAAIYGINQNYMGAPDIPQFQNTFGGAWKIKDIMNAAIAGYNNRGIGSGLKIGVYANVNGGGATEIISNTSTALLADAAPGTNAKSGVFRWGRFYVGDPWNSYSGSKRIAFFVDGAPNYNGSDNPKFGRIGINTYTPQYALEVNGQPAHGSVTASLGIIYASDDIIAFSDVRQKTNIVQIGNSLSLINNLVGVRFNKANGTEDKITNTRPVIEGERTKIGLIAQEVEKVLPEVVYTNDDGYKSIGYANIVALLIEGIKEQQKQIDELKKQVQELKG